MHDCPACGRPMTEEAERTTRLLIATLDERRAVRLSDTYQGDPPRVLCASCFLVTAEVLNGTTDDHRTRT